jgi:hypothetical protein
MEAPNMATRHGTRLQTAVLEGSTLTELVVEQERRKREDGLKRGENNEGKMVKKLRQI